MRCFQITETKVGGLRLAVFEDGIEIAGAGTPTGSDDDYQWLLDRAGEFGAAYQVQTRSEGGSDAAIT